MIESTRPSVGFLRAFAHALLDRETSAVRSNSGLWLGFVLAIPIPVLAVAESAPLWVILASLVAPVAWGVIVGASRRVGIIGEDLIRRMRLEALNSRRIREETHSGLHDRAATERSARRKLERHLRVADAELALAQVIQEGLVSPDIEQHDLTVVLRQIPCSYVGGDYLQAVLPRPDLLYLCVGDVAGHGVPAALVVSRIHGLVQRMIVGEVRPGPFLDSLHRSMLDLLEHTILFATFAVLRIDLAACSIEYATASHPPQLLLHSGQAVEELMTPNCALGMELTALSPKILVGKTTFETGDTLLLFTDGLLEAREPSEARAVLGRGDPQVPVRASWSRGSRRAGGGDHRRGGRIPRRAARRGRREPAGRSTGDSRPQGDAYHRHCVVFVRDIALVLEPASKT